MLNIDGEYFGPFASQDYGDPGEFICPTGIALDHEGRVYITDEFLHRISVPDDSGTFLAK